VRHLHFEHHDGNDDGDYTIAKGFKPVLTHANHPPSKKLPFDQHRNRRWHQENQQEDGQLLLERISRLRHADPQVYSGRDKPDRNERRLPTPLAETRQFDNRPQRKPANLQ
jgi:hypothetical protein